MYKVEKHEEKKIEKIHSKFYIIRCKHHDLILKNKLFYSKFLNFSSLLIQTYLIILFS
jgi:hypothetical protein